MEIHSIKLKSKTNSNMFVASTDNGEFILHSDIIVSKGISKGEVDDKTFYSAVDESEVLIGSTLAMKYLGSRMKTERGIRDYLKQKGYSYSSIDRIVTKLVDYSIIDDRSYAEAYIKSNPNFSRMKLREKLKIAGVDRCIVDELTQDVDEVESCGKSCEKFLRNKTLDNITREKLYRHLLSKGYSYDTINSVINKYVREE